MNSKRFIQLYKNSNAFVVRSQDGQHHVLVHKTINVINTHFKGHNLMGRVTRTSFDDGVVELTVHYESLDTNAVIFLTPTIDGVNVYANTNLVIKGGTI